MKITVLNGNPDANDIPFDNYLKELSGKLQADQYQVQVLDLRDMEIRYCIGCFGCWVKTPGECFAPDESKQVRQAVIQSDFTLFASPLRMGFQSALLKRMMDKLIPLIHPYFVVDRNEAHHRARYDHYPRFGLLLQKEIDTDTEDLRIVGDIFSRTALNLKTRLAFSMLTDQPVERVAEAITTPSAASVPFEPYPKPTNGVRIQPPTRITVFNGSPRGSKGNTPILLENFLKGFTANGKRSYQLYHLNHLKDADVFREVYGQAECVLLGFPLYTDGMPGFVKTFIESLEGYRGRKGNPPIGFVVHSGFPEAVHSRHVEKYLQKLAARLDAPYIGTLVKGGSEGVRLMPENMNRKLFDALFETGRTFAETGQFDPLLLQQIAKPEKYPFYLAPIFKLLSRTPLSSFYWDGLLKRNGAYEQRFAKPYAKS